ncbi:MAG: hypothetical protein NC402_00905 [Prevotella sp.]|nr:hypothetical protein [Prevotella sp.]MCM1074366.1 hypothetical protein [Ruminococcus sp.]
MTSFMRYILCLICCILLSHIGFAGAVSGNIAAQSPEQHMAEGRTYFEKRDPTNALLRFQTVSELIITENPSTDEAHCAIRALNNPGCVYKHFYYDYAFITITHALTNTSRRLTSCVSNTNTMIFCR